LDVNEKSVFASLKCDATMCEQLLQTELCEGK